jgi:hypothetical protein
MGVTNRDASLSTQRRRQLALYAWRLSNQYPQNPQSIRPEQANSAGFQQAGPTGDVPTNARLGAALVGQTPGASCPCTGVTLQGYDKKSPAC